MLIPILIPILIADTNRLIRKTMLASQNLDYHWSAHARCERCKRAHTILFGSCKSIDTNGVSVIIFQIAFLIYSDIILPLLHFLSRFCHRLFYVQSVQSIHNLVCKLRIDRYQRRWRTTCCNRPVGR